MWVTPAYVALLAQRRAVPAPPAGLAPEEYRRAVARSAPDYVFLSTYHPRDTIRDTAWRSGLAALEGRGQAVHTRTDSGGGGSAVLLKVDAALLAGGRK